MSTNSVTSPRATSPKGVWAVRSVLALLLLIMSASALFVTFKGIRHASVMDQAQIARNVASGKGMVTNFIRPLDVLKVTKLEQRKGEEIQTPATLSSFPNIHHAPLNIYAMALALRVTGYHDYDASRLQLAQNDKLGIRIYPGDRVIAATSLIFFLLAMLLGYTLLLRLFDEWIAASVSLFMIFNTSVMDYAVSGLPQPLMMCCLLAAGHFILSAIATKDTPQLIMRQRLYMALAIICLALMALAGWSAMWCTVGFAIFCAIYFRNGITYALAALVLMASLVILTIAPVSEAYGDPIQYYFLWVSNCLGNDGADAALRSGVDAASAINNSSFILHLLAHSFSFFGSTASMMGGIFITSLFFLSLLKTYKRSVTNGTKWAFFVMWCACTFGMSLTAGEETTVGTSQLLILFLPIFAAYGMSLIFNFTAQLNLSPNLNVARGFVLALLLCICAGPQISALIRQIPLGFALRDIGLAHFPPYYPPALFGRPDPQRPGFVDLTNPSDAVVTDQPWAVAWYGNRKAIWLPDSVHMYEEMANWVSTVNSRIQGILITPTSTVDVKQGMMDITSRNGEFSPLAMEASVLLLDPKHQTRITDLFMEKASRSSDAKPLGYIVSSRGEFSQPRFLLGAYYVLYTRPGDTLPQ